MSGRYAEQRSRSGQVRRAPRAARQDARRARAVTAVVSAVLAVALAQTLLVQFVRQPDGTPAVPLPAWEWNAVSLVPLAALAFHWHPAQRSTAPNMEPAILISSCLYLAYAFLAFAHGDLRLFPALLASAGTLAGVWTSNRQAARES
ncbi:hypothetical protein [Streptomyces sp. ODS28]|uniref:hypothetical protein n=1 Tax=Streptomyces sp. ODS28 TaxID=3136688 RepID=UPI0031ECE3A4